MNDCPEMNCQHLQKTPGVLTVFSEMELKINEHASPIRHLACKVNCY